MYKKLSGMTGTAMTEAGELKDIYNLDVVSVPTHTKVTRIDHDDAIYGTKAEKYEAVIELIKNCHEKGQPVLVGTISIEKSEEISKELTKNKITHNVLNAKMHEREAHVIAQAGRYAAVTIATNMAGRGTDIMLGGNPDMMITDLDPSLSNQQRTREIGLIKDLIKKEKAKVIEAGGLCVIGTERHESRRIDNQLRGRSGRQGDPGSTQFFLSLEDDLMRIFASERISGVLRTLGLKGGEAIHHPMISRSLEKAQQKVEGHHYETRKSLLKFDDVMNDQRKIIYEQRNEIIASSDVTSFVENLSEQFCSSLVHQFVDPNKLREDWRLEELIFEIHRTLSMNFSAEEISGVEGAEEEIASFLYKKVIELYEQKLSLYGEPMKSASKYILLTTLDQAWKEHLHNLDYLRQGISLRAYGQKDPLSEYKREAFGLFEKMLDNLRELFVQRICFLHIDLDHLNKASMTLANKKLQEMRASRTDPAFEKYNAGSDVVATVKPFKALVAEEDRDPSDPETWGKISRNELCPCGSGKKYKHCHGIEV
jgi:preprotein translocase subunit SecA